MSDTACQHLCVVRHGALPSGVLLDRWTCTVCGAEFYHPENIGFPGQTIQIMEPQLTLRDQFAMAAMTGIISGTSLEEATKYPFARIAYAAADDMLEARKS